MYELRLAIVSHPRTSCRQNKNLLWLIRKTGQLWIDCTQPGYGNINSNDSGRAGRKLHVCVRSLEEGTFFNMEYAETGQFLIFDDLRVLVEISADTLERDSSSLFSDAPPNTGFCAKSIVLFLKDPRHILFSRSVKPLTSLANLPASTRSRWLVPLPFWGTCFHSSALWGMEHRYRFYSEPLVALIFRGKKEPLWMNCVYQGKERSKYSRKLSDGGGEGQGGRVCCSPWGGQESGKSRWTMITMD